MEDAVLEQVYQYLDGLQQVDYTDEIQQMISKSSSKDKDRLKYLQKERQEIKKKIDVLDEELTKVLIGESELSKEHIDRVLNKNIENLESLDIQIKEIEEKIQVNVISETEALAVQKLVPVWREVFDSASLEVKKVLLSLLIEKIVVTGKDIDIYFRINMTDFLNRIKYSNGGRAGGSASPIILPQLQQYITFCSSWSTNHYKNIYTKTLEKHVKTQM